MRHLVDCATFAQNLFSDQRRITVMLTGFLCCTVPAYAANSSATRLDRINTQQKITIVAVKGTTTFFSKDRFLHGFGHDLSHAYASHLNVKLHFKQVSSTQAALRAVAEGRADAALTTASNEQLAQRELQAVNLSCNEPALLARHGLNSQVNWSFKAGDMPLWSHAEQFICQEKALGITQRLAAFYDQTVLQNRVERVAFHQALNTRLPRYAATFRQHAQQHALDWHLLVAMGYQESHLDAAAVSPTGVRGIMMLTEATAQGLGIDNREDPMQSIQGGAKYLAQLQRYYAAIPQQDRLWFTLAAYNMGPNAIDQVRRRVAQAGQDPNRWAHVFRYLSDNAARRGQYRQVIHYVTHIRSYLENMKQDQRIARL